jgi:hypothetical protein
MTTDIFGTSNFKKNEKEILDLARHKLYAELSEACGCKVDSVTIYVDMDRRYIHYDWDLTFTLNPKYFIKVEIISGLRMETIEGDAAESIYKRYLELVSKYTMQSKKSFVCRSLL